MTDSTCETASPGPVDNSCLYKDDKLVRPDLVRDVDYRLVSLGVWLEFCSFFGESVALMASDCFS